MMRPGGPGDGSPSIESLRELRLRALLNDLVNDLGPVKAAEELGVDRKTLRRGQRAPELSPRLAEALERLLLERAGAVAGDEAKRIAGLEREVGELSERVAELEGQLSRVPAAVGDGGMGADAGDGRAAGDEYAQGLRRLERRVERLEAGEGAAAGAFGGAGAGRARSQRRYPDLVTREAADDDDVVYGDAWPLVSEWRTLWAVHSPMGKGLAWAVRRERILELEVAMLEEHGLTLPPETAPLRGLDRREQLSWRQRELAGVRRRRARLELLRWVRRALTLGLWRK